MAVYVPVNMSRFLRQICSAHKREMRSVGMSSGASPYRTEEQELIPTGATGQPNPPEN
jgi:hypothetical protein